MHFAYGSFLQDLVLQTKLSGYWSIPILTCGHGLRYGKWPKGYEAEVSLLHMVAPSVVGWGTQQLERP